MRGVMSKARKAFPPCGIVNSLELTRWPREARSDEGWRRTTGKVAFLPSSGASHHLLPQGVKVFRASFCEYPA